MSGATKDGAYQPNPAWADYVRKLVDEAPPLTPEQRIRLSILLNGPSDGSLSSGGTVEP
jgi:hypothetical protein